MKVNSLYGTLQYELSQRPDYKLKNEIVPIKAVTIDNKNYYRLTLLSNQLGLTEGWLLNEAHFSIYEELDLKNPVLGPSHFTATWSNADGEFYRLHIFLDNNDLLACQPTWDKIEESGQFNKASLPDGIDSLVHVILQLGLPYLQQLRHQQALTGRSLELEYNKLEKATQKASLNLPLSKELFLDQIDKIKPIVYDLYQVTGHVKWSRLQSYFNKFAQALLNQPGVSTGLSTDTPELSVEKNQASQTGRNGLFNPPEIKKNQALVESKSVFNKIISLNKHLLKSIKDEDKISILNDIINKIYLFDFNDWNLSFAEMEKLKNIEKNIEKTAYPLLQTALITNQFERAQSLQAFYYLLNSNIYAFSLRQNNFQLLNFLISNLHIPVNNYEFTVDEINYPNALIYCVQKHTKDNSLINCFAELIKGGGNLMLPIAPNQAPLAHVLLSADPAHPLYPALEKTAELTVENKGFYQQLITALIAYKKQVIDQKEMTKIDSAILNYRQMTNGIGIAKKILNNQSMVAIKELSKTAESLTSPSLISQVKADADVVDSRHAFEVRIQNLIRRIKKYRGHRTNLPLNSLIQADLKKIQDTLVDMDPIDLSFAELKREVLNNYRLMSMLFNEIDTLLDIAQEISSKPMVIGRRNKQVNKLLRNKEETESRIEEITAQLPINVLKELNLSAENEILTNLKELNVQLNKATQTLAELGLFNINEFHTFRKGDDETRELEKFKLS